MHTVLRYATSTDMYHHHDKFRTCLVVSVHVWWSPTPYMFGGPRTRLMVSVHVWWSLYMFGGPDCYIISANFILNIAVDTGRQSNAL